MTGTVDFSVDLEQLQALAGELQRLVAALEDLDRPVQHADGTAMGGDDVADAIQRFVGRWRSGRTDLLQHLNACREIVDLAIEGYGTADDKLRCVVEPAGQGART